MLLRCKQQLHTCCAQMCVRLNHSHLTAQLLLAVAAGGAVYCTAQAALSSLPPLVLAHPGKTHLQELHHACSKDGKGTHAAGPACRAADSAAAAGSSLSRVAVRWRARGHESTHAHFCTHPQQRAPHAARAGKCGLGGSMQPQQCQPAAGAAGWQQPCHARRSGGRELGCNATSCGRPRRARARDDAFPRSCSNDTAAHAPCLLCHLMVSQPGCLSSPSQSPLLPK